MTSIIRNNRFLKIIYICIISVLLISCGTGETFEKYYDLGMKYLSEGNYEEAILSFTAAVEIEPKAKGYIGRGDAYFAWAEEIHDEVEKYESALADYLEALEIDNKLVEGYEKAADAYVALWKGEEAIAILQQGYELTGNEKLEQKINELLKKGIPATLTGMIFDNDEVYKERWNELYAERTEIEYWASIAYGIKPREPFYIEMGGTKHEINEFEFLDIVGAFTEEEEFDGLEEVYGPFLNKNLVMKGKIYFNEEWAEVTGPEMEYGVMTYTYNPNGPFAFEVNEWEFAQ